MNYSGEAAEQVVKMSLSGIEVAAKISGQAAERLAVLLYAVLRDQKKTRGKIRLTNMLRSGKELKVFAVKDEDLKKFCDEAKKYGVLYCVLKDTNADDGLTDIMVRADDASKVNRIFERFGLATIDMASVKTTVEKDRENKAKEGEEIPEPDRVQTVDDKVNEFLDKVTDEKENPTAEKQQNENPTTARTTKSRQSEPSSAPRNEPGGGVTERSTARVRPSVRQELNDIRAEQRQKPGTTGRERNSHRETRHQPVQRKKRSGKEQR